MTVLEWTVDLARAVGLGVFAVIALERTARFVTGMRNP